MATPKFKVESGMQMLTRITKKPQLESFYPNLFKSGPRQGHVIEIFSNNDTSILLCDIICESLLPVELGGKEAGVIIFNTDGKLNINFLKEALRKKLITRRIDESKHNSYLITMLSNLYMFGIYHTTQLHATIHNLESILINCPNISLVIFDSLTAFYWSEQNARIVKMDLYIKVLLRIIQVVVKDYKVVILYIRPKYFSSSKEHLDKLEACCENPTIERLNYRIEVIYNEDGIHYADVRSFGKPFRSLFKLLGNNVQWV